MRSSAGHSGQADRGSTDGKVIADAVESFEVSEDAKVWVFRLRKGAEFDNGKSLEAEDVVALINHHRGADSIGGEVPSHPDVKADGKNVVVVTLDSGNADFLYRRGLSPAHPACEGRKGELHEGYRTRPDKKTGFDPGVRGAASRFENCYGRTNFDEVETRHQRRRSAHNALTVMM